MQQSNNSMKRILLIIGIIIIGLVSSYRYLDKRVSRFDLPEGELRWSHTRPQNARMCIPAAFTTPSGRIAGAYRINGKNYNNNNRRKVSLRDNTFIITNKWRTDNGFQQLTLVYNSRPMKFKDSRRCIRRALCKDKEGAFILQSNYPMTMSSFAYYCSKYCSDAAYLDMGEYGYGYIKKNRFVRPLYIWGFFRRHKQTNWIYIE